MNKTEHKLNTSIEENISSGIFCEPFKQNENLQNFKYITMRYIRG